MTSNEVEAATVSSMYINSDVVDDVRDVLGPSGVVFGNVLLGEIYERMIGVYNEHGRYDATLLADALTTRQMVELTQVAQHCQTSANAEKYASAVLAHHVRREAESGCRTIGALAQEQAEPNAIMEALADLENRLAGAVVGDNTHALGDSVEDVVLQLQRQIEADGKIQGIPSGISRLDQMTGGWTAGELVIVAARPSVGKSAFALHLARVAAESGTPVYFASLEMSAETLCQRLLLQMAGTPLDNFQSGFRGKESLGHVADAGNDLARLPIYVDDSSRASIWDIRGRARRCQRKHGKGLIIVDYLQLVKGGGKTRERHLEVAEISAGLKALARDQKCPVIALCQMNRAGDGDQLGPQTLKYLRESGSIEQDADKVFFLARPTDKESDSFIEANPGADREMLLCSFLAKNRNGATGPVALNYERPTQRIWGHRDPEPQAAALSAPAPITDDIENTYEDDDLAF